MTTPILDLDEWTEAQAQPNLTVNEAFRWLECFAQLSVVSKTETAPPVSPVDGDSYIVADSATGAWVGQDQNVALYISTAWAFRTAPQGAIAFVRDEDDHFKFVSGSPSSWDLL